MRTAARAALALASPSLMMSSSVMGTLVQRMTMGIEILARGISTPFTARVVR